MRGSTLSKSAWSVICPVSSVRLVRGGKWGTGPGLAVVGGTGPRVWCWRWSGEVPSALASTAAVVEDAAVAPAPAAVVALVVRKGRATPPGGAGRVTGGA